MARRPRKSADQLGQTNFADLLHGENDTPEHPTARLLKERNAALTHLADFVPVFRVKLVRTDTLAFRERTAISGPGRVAALLQEHLKDADRENFAIVLLDTKNKVIGICTASLGTLGEMENIGLIPTFDEYRFAFPAGRRLPIACHNFLVCYSSMSGHPRTADPAQQRE